ncbi:MAG TPA: formylglycine-generating enzyme family protein [Saprospiraceae bacterium]|nr:formylglycine-generating enzyme family protein [Saprospiraceae bacterium]
MKNSLMTIQISLLTILLPNLVAAQDSLATTTTQQSQLKSGLMLKTIDGGTFFMGAPETELERDDDECQYQVTVPSFSIGIYEVTQADWKSVMGKRPEESTYPDCDDCPVESVSWNDIQIFLFHLNQKTGQSYRLPTEVEWEFAAKGGVLSGHFKYAGTNDMVQSGWYSDNAMFKPHPVGGMIANELGLYDLSGNVWEWCQNTYDPYPCDTTTVGINTVRVIRGGSWFNNLVLRTTVRSYNKPTMRANDLGFRLAQNIRQ